MSSTIDLSYPIGRFDTSAPVDPSMRAPTFRHPDIGIMTLDAQLQSYAWHSRHHVAHITSLRHREGW